MPLGSFGGKLRVRNVNPFGKRAKGAISLPVLRRRKNLEPRYEAIFGETRTVLAEDAPPSRFPIGQLPSELLAEVFYWYITAVNKESRTSSEARPSPYAWLILGHVCRAWRGVLLGYPKLYTYICMTRSECVETMISRAGDLPLQLHDPLVCTTTPTKQVAMNTLVLTHILRCMTADLTISNPLISPAPVPQLLQVGTSQLRELNLQFWHFPDIRVELDSPVFPNMKFPHLHSLTCSFGSLPSIKNMLHTGLRRLDISRCGRVSPDQLLAVLAPLQALEELHLRDACVEPEASVVPTSTEELASPPQHAVVLPRLRHLVIHDYWSDQGIILLHRLVYPASASVRIHLSGFQASMYDFIRSVVVAKLSGQGVLGVPPEPQSFSMLAGFDIKLHLTLWARRQTLAEIERKRYGAEDAFFQLAVSFVTSEAAVGALVRQLPLAGTRSAMLAEQVVEREPLARTPLVAGLPLLEELALEYESFAPPPDAPPANLRGPADAPLDAADPAGAFPSLKVLRVHELHHEQALQLAEHVSELGHLARWLGAMRVTDKTPFARLALDSRRSDFATVPLCCSSCSGSHTMGPYVPLATLPVSDMVPCCCLPCFYLAAGIGRVVNFFTRRRI